MLQDVKKPTKFKSPAQHMIREGVATKQAVPFADEYNQGLLSQHILKPT